ncbi:SDR family oxidoreductase [Fibrella sp. WM1]|uniref:SDR family oxidoreductase n=1 Tax=Fibrella musci TaxID=3242485 RepID=UPI003522D7D5
MKHWLITGASRGFGKIWAEAALKRGDKVAATARNTDDLSELVATYGDAILPIQLDVTDRQANIDAVQQAHQAFGQLDLLVSNAGYGHFGAIEEVTEAEARQQLETNLFGSLWLIQAALPIMREQGSGHIIQVSSVGGVAAFASLGMYHASKWGIEAICESLSQEVADFGINVTLIEPGGFDTDWRGDSAKRSQPIAAYDPIREKRAQMMKNTPQGNPEATAAALMKVVDAEKPPLRIFFGSMPLKIVEPTYQKRLDIWREWNSVSEEAQG